MSFIADLTPDPESKAPALRLVEKPRSSERAWTIDILLVDDDEADCSLILSALRGDPRVNNVTATNAPDAVLFDIATGRVRPNLILLDIHMPRLSGFKFLEALRRIPRMDATPVVFLTTSRFARDVAQARAASAHSYIVKPESYAELKAKLEAVVEAAVTDAWSR
ncbi:MAG TPA: response regulator [Caulobacterales bacterium]|nr:response regulator [Caulobacterales bacterium]